jgi:competence protein ComEC
MVKKACSLIGCVVIAATMLAGCADVPEQAVGIDSGTYIEKSQIAESVILDNNNDETVISAEILSEDVNTTDIGGQMQVHYIDVGQGDSTLITCDGHALLIDAGNNDKGSAVQLYLQKQNISKLDAVIWTHPDADHIGGADVITTKFDIETTYMSSVTDDTKTYEELINAINYKGYKITAPTVGTSFELGGAKVTFLGPSVTYSDDNDNSIVCMVEYGNNKFLFTGDAQTEEETALVNSGVSLSADVYKAGHHGSRTSSSELLLNAVNPKYAVISCGEGNSYGHPHSEVLNNLCVRGINVFRTDEEGSIIATSDGTNIIWNMAPSDSWKAGEPITTSSNNTTVTDTSTSNVENITSKSTITGSYIGNKNNMKLHKASCNSLPDLKNQVPFSSLEEAQSSGYTKENQCKRCYPYGK